MRRWSSSSSTSSSSLDHSPSAFQYRSSAALPAALPHQKSRPPHSTTWHCPCSSASAAAVAAATFAAAALAAAALRRAACFSAALRRAACFSASLRFSCPVPSVPAFSARALLPSPCGVPWGTGWLSVC